MRPFVYIASLRRTGSTVLSEALTRLPEAFVFREPGLGRNVAGFFERDVEALAAFGVYLDRFERRHRLGGAIRRKLGLDRGFMIRRFAREVARPLLARLEQVGVKETQHQGWRYFKQELPSMRIVLTARDPRDVYVSLANRFRAGKGRWRGEFSPERVAEDLLGEFRHQQDMDREHRCMRVRYEDLCMDPGCFDEIRRFVDSPLQGLGEVGAFNRSEATREHEAQLHGSQLTPKQVGRWKRESDPQLRAEAERVLDLMPEYASFWGYS